MAAKPKKSSKKKGSAGPSPAYRAVLYGLDKGTEKGDAVRLVLDELGIPARTAGLEQLGSSVGALAGCTGMHVSKKPYEGEIPDCEFLLLCNIPDKLLNAALAAMQERGCSVGCKATLTAYNRLWPFATLISEVSREHELL